MRQVDKCAQASNGFSHGRVQTAMPRALRNRRHYSRTGAPRYPGQAAGTAAATGGPRSPFFLFSLSLVDEPRDFVPRLGYMRQRRWWWVRSGVPWPQGEP